MREREGKREKEGKKEIEKERGGREEFFDPNKIIIGWGILMLEWGNQYAAENKILSPNL